MSVLTRRMLLGISILLLVVLVLFLGEQASFIRNSAKVVAVVERIESDYAKCEFLDKSNRTCKEVVFKAALKYDVEGVTHRMKISSGRSKGSSRSESLANHHVGKLVPLRYNVSNPSYAIEDSFFSIWGASLFILVAGSLAYYMSLSKPEPTYDPESEDSEYEDADEASTDDAVQEKSVHSSRPVSEVSRRPSVAAPNPDGSDEDDKEFASRYGTRTEADDVDWQGKPFAYVSRTSPSESSRPKKAERPPVVIETGLNIPVRFIGFLFGMASFAVTGYYGFKLFAMDGSTQSGATLIKSIILLVIFCVAVGAAGVAYRALEIFAGILDGLYRLRRK